MPTKRKHLRIEKGSTGNCSLLTDLPVDDLKAAVCQLEQYGMRWKIEVFHMVLKSGCRAEQTPLRTADRLTNLFAIFCIIA